MNTSSGSVKLTCSWLFTFLVIPGSFGFGGVTVTGSDSLLNFGSSLKLILYLAVFGTLTTSSVVNSVNSSAFKLSLSLALNLTTTFLPALFFTWSSDNLTVRVLPSVLTSVIVSPSTVASISAAPLNSNTSFIVSVTSNAVACFGTCVSIL